MLLQPFIPPLPAFKYQKAKADLLVFPWLITPATFMAGTIPPWCLGVTFIHSWCSYTVSKHWHLSLHQQWPHAHYDAFFWGSSPRIPASQVTCYPESKPLGWFPNIWRTIFKPNPNLGRSEKQGQLRLAGLSLCCHTLDLYRMLSEFKSRLLLLEITSGHFDPNIKLWDTLHQFANTQDAVHPRCR